MTSTRRATNRAVKRESTHFGGLPTPNQSMSSNAGIITLKQEIIDVTSEDSSDTVEAPVIKSNHGLPTIEDEGYATQAAERRLRSTSRKFKPLFLLFHCAYFGQSITGQFFSDPESGSDSPPQPLSSGSISFLYRTLHSFHGSAYPRS
jgi:hypothetical protein